MVEQKYFPTQAAEEKIFLLIRKHWFNYIIFIFLAVLILIPVITVIIYLVLNQGQISVEIAILLTIAASLALMFLMGVELYGFINFYLDVYIVTDQRLVDISQNGMFNRHISELQIRQVQDVSAHVEGFFDTILHFGDVYIETAGNRENFIFSSIPHPYTVSKLIVDLHEKAVESLEGVEVSAPKEYTEEQLEKGLLPGEIEAQAKALISDPTKVVHQTQGVYIPKTNKAAITSFSAGGDKAVSNQGHELKEGEEEKISDQ